MKKIVVFTGAGISAESGLKTFRDADGLWAEYRIEDVCTPEALARNRALVVEFYNMRRRELAKCQPNAAHRAVAELANIGYFFLQQIYHDLKIKSFFDKITADTKIKFDPNLVN
ncbi:MAG: hypothetical protein IIV28_06250, partial [Alistipes sp.]|nr:hypothetical protein [Alistipes sp.]